MSIFSIDVEAHLRKAASHTFGSAAHYPVELVRAALRRGGRDVHIMIGRDRIQLQDNGPGMDTASIHTLIRLMDPSQPEAVKEEAVESLQTREGMGLLAIFASNPEEILLENVSRGRKTRVHFRGSQLKTSGPCSLTKGTRITLFSGGRDYSREKHILEAFCRSVPRGASLKLNNRPLGGQSFLAHQMAAMELSPSTFTRTYTAGGRVGIPLAGMTCHLRLLDQFIPWHHLTLPPQQGFIFDAAVETTEDVTPELIGYLCEYAHRLYQWMCRRYPSAAPDHRGRFEELLFTHCRLTGNESYLNQFSPFKIFNSRRSLTLQQVKQKAAGGSLYAVPRKKKKKRPRYHTGNKTVLSLPRTQADLLINQLNVPITFLNPVTRRQNPLPKLRHTVRKKIKRLLCYILPGPKKILTTEQLGKSEQTFLLALIRNLTRSGESMPEQIQVPAGGAVMVQGRGLFPAVPAKTRNKHSTSPQRLLIRRGHPLVRKAIKAVETDPRNIEMFIPLLIF